MSEGPAVRIACDRCGAECAHAFVSGPSVVVDVVRAPTTGRRQEWLCVPCGSAASITPQDDLLSAAERLVAICNAPLVEGRAPGLRAAVDAVERAIANTRGATPATLLAHRGGGA